MKKYIPWGMLVCLFLFLTTCDLFRPQAEFEITSWDQAYYSSTGDWGYVYIYYDITNTGSVTIDYYEVWFDVTCADSSVYSDWTNGLNVAPGKTYSDWTITNTADKQATSVAVSDYELTTY